VQHGTYARHCGIDLARCLLACIDELAGFRAHQFQLMNKPGTVAAECLGLAGQVLRPSFQFLPPPDCCLEFSQGSVESVEYFIQFMSVCHLCPWQITRIARGLLLISIGCEAGERNAAATAVAAKWAAFC
jgi:hypothetical protein